MSRYSEIQSNYNIRESVSVIVFNESGKEVGRYDNVSQAFKKLYISSSKLSTVLRQLSRKAKYKVKPTEDRFGNKFTFKKFDNATD